MLKHSGILFFIPVFFVVTGCNLQQSKYTISHWNPVLRITDENSPLKGFKIVIPAEEINNEIIIKLTATGEYPALTSNLLRSIGPAVDISAESGPVDFTMPVTVTLPLTEKVGNIPLIGYYNQVIDKWEYMAPDTFMIGEKVISFKTNHLSLFMPLALDVGNLYDILEEIRSDAALFGAVKTIVQNGYDMGTALTTERRLEELRDHYYDNMDEMDEAYEKCREKITCELAYADLPRFLNEQFIQTAADKILVDAVMTKAGGYLVIKSAFTIGAIVTDMMLIDCITCFLPNSVVSRKWWSNYLKYMIAESLIKKLAVNSRYDFYNAAYRIGDREYTFTDGRYTMDDNPFDGYVIRDVKKTNYSKHPYEYLIRMEYIGGNRIETIAKLVFIQNGKLYQIAELISLGSYLEFRDNYIITSGVRWASYDPQCCPSLHYYEFWKWEENQFVLDKITEETDGQSSESEEKDLMDQSDPEKNDEYSSPNNPLLVDGNGRTYKTVRIGDQVWMAENMAYLPSLHTPRDESYTYPRYYVYDYQGDNLIEGRSTRNYKMYGALYNWPAARNICPVGWHLPGEQEWKILIDNLGGQKNAGRKLKEGGTTHWQYPNVSGNSSGFTALPGGNRFRDGTFLNLGNMGYFWSSTSDGNSMAVGFYVYSNSAVISYGSDDKDRGYAVRCLKD